MDLPGAVIDTYDAARAEGRSRADALLGAVAVYVARHPELSVSEAGNEVVRILRRAADLAAAEAQMLACAGGSAASAMHEQGTTSCNRG